MLTVPTTIAINRQEMFVSTFKGTHTAYAAIVMVREGTHSNAVLQRPTHHGPRLRDRPVTSRVHHVRREKQGENTSLHAVQLGNTPRFN